MAVRFIIGRAGTGKTHHCLESIRGRLRDDPIEGPRLLLLVPEQASLQMEQAILRQTQGDNPAKSSGCAHRASVLSFKRLAFKALESAGGPQRNTLTEPARTMVLRHLVATLADRLRFYRRVARHGASPARLGGFVEKLSRTVGELIEEAITPSEFGAILDTESTTSDSPIDQPPIQQAKLHDLHLIYQSYIDYLGDDRLDPSMHLQNARAALDQCPWIDGTQLWVDGFASLSGQETLTLIALAKRCQTVDITVMIDPKDATPPSAHASTARLTTDLFTRPARTFFDLHGQLVKAGLEVGDPLIFSPTASSRFEGNTSLAGMERGLFQFAPPDTAAKTDVKPDRVELVELPTHRLEVQYAVSRIRRWTDGTDASYRYRDIAIIVRDLEPYHDLLGQALGSRNVPFFIDRRRPVAYHPLVELLRSAATILTESLSLPSMRSLLKNSLLPIETDDADELENFLVARGIQGPQAWDDDTWGSRLRSGLAEANQKPKPHERAALDRISASREAVIAAIAPWRNFADSATAHTGPEWTSTILKWFEHLGVPAKLSDWTDQADADGDLNQAEEHRQVWRDIVSFLDDLAFAFDKTQLTALELSDVLEAGLSELTLGLVPPTVDQILVGSIERSRHPDIRAAVILGFNDGMFPKQLEEDSILNDDDRTLLNESDVRVAPGTRERVFDESLLLYVALTRASESLVVTFASANEDGKALHASPYLSALKDSCPGLEVSTLGDPVRLRDTWDILSTNDLTQRIAAEFRSRRDLRQDDHALRATFNELYDAVRGELGQSAMARRALSSLTNAPDSSLSKKTVERLFGHELRTSVSRLESFAACPFQFFARYALGLKERAHAELEAVDVGQVHHAILEEFVRSLGQRDGSFNRLSDEALMQGLSQSCTQVAKAVVQGELRSDARNAYMLRRSASRIARLLGAQRNRSKAGSSQPRAAELPFGFTKPGGLPALEVITPAGRHVKLRGFIDRVDLAEVGDELLGIVIDYKKTRDKRLELDKVYHGLSLQLVAYMLALAEVGETLAGRPIRPVGALYLSFSNRYEKVEHPEMRSQRDQHLNGTLRPRGLLSEDAIPLLEAVENSTWAKEYGIYRGKDGSLGRLDSSDAADQEQFKSVMDKTRTKLGELADGVLDGKVEVSPFRLGDFSPCSWCTMTSVCRFEMGISDVRFLEKFKRSEAFNKIAGDPN